MDRDILHSIEQEARLYPHLKFMVASPTSMPTKHAVCVVEPATSRWVWVGTKKGKSDDYERVFVYLPPVFHLVLLTKFRDKYSSLHQMVAFCGNEQKPNMDTTLYAALIPNCHRFGSPCTPLTSPASTFVAKGAGKRVVDTINSLWGSGFNDDMSYFGGDPLYVKFKHRFEVVAGDHQRDTPERALLYGLGKFSGPEEIMDMLVYHTEKNYKVGAERKIRAYLGITQDEEIETRDI